MGLLEAVLNDKAQSEKPGRIQKSQSRGNGKRKGAPANDAGGSSKRNRKSGSKFCSYCKSNGKSRKVFTSHDVGDCSFLKDKKSGKKDAKTVQRAFALIKEQAKRLEKLEGKRKRVIEDDDDSDSSY